MQRATASSSTLQVTYGICFQRATPFLVFCKKLLNTSLWVGTKYWLRKCPTIWAFARDKLPKKLVFSSLFREICTQHSQWFWVFIAGSGSGQKWTDTGRTLKNAHQFFFLFSQMIEFLATRIWPTRSMAIRLKQAKSCFISAWNELDRAIHS